VNLNIQAAQIHLLGDGIQCVGVVIAALIIYFKPSWKLADPITTFVFALLVLCTTIPTFIECINILLEHSPSDLDCKELYEKILSVSFELTSNYSISLLVWMKY
jgi:zinc transporter 2